MPVWPIVDTHVHLIDPERVPLRWGQDAPSLNKPFGMAELNAVRGETELDAIVFVEADVVAGRHLDEVAMVEDMAERDPRIAAIVAHAPLELGDAVQTDLDRLAARPLVRGIRRLIQNEYDPQWSMGETFLAGVRHLAAHDLHFEICIYHHQASAAVQLAKSCPNVRFVLDHIGKPDIKAELLEPWRQDIHSFAELPNVVCKLSGLVTEADHDHWQPADLRPYIDYVIDEFGFDRLMFGSDWPVASLASGYPRWVAVLDDALSGASRDELERFYGRNAKSFYRLNPQPLDGGRRASASQSAPPRSPG